MMRRRQMRRTVVDGPAHQRQGQQRASKHEDTPRFWSMPVAGGMSIKIARTPFPSSLLELAGTVGIPAALRQIKRTPPPSRWRKSGTYLHSRPQQARTNRKKEQEGGGWKIANKMSLWTR